jgi:phosphoglycolate phosphatase
MPWPKLVIFDWDGTLVDSIDPILRGFQLAYEKAGHPCPPTSELRATIGLPLAAAFEQLTPGLPSATMVTLYREYWFDPQRPPSSWARGALELLLWLKREGVLLAVATGKSRQGLDMELDQHGKTSFFSITRSADDGEPKPHPDMLHQILSHLEVKPEHAVLVGDSPLDLQMARAAGIAAYGVLGGVGSQDLLQAMEPRAVVPSLDHLPPWLTRTPTRTGRIPRSL